MVELREYSPSVWTGEKMAGHFSHMIVFENGSIIYSPINHAEQVQPNGIDLTVDKVFMYSTGPVFTKDKELIEPGYLIEQLPDDLAGLPEDTKGWFLEPTHYLIEWREVITIPKDVIGLLSPRSTLLRVGSTITGALWDRGYEGKGRSGLIVGVSMLLEWGARLGQMVFIDAKKGEKLYDGQYQRENLPDK